MVQALDAGQDDRLAMLAAVYKAIQAIEAEARQRDQAVEHAALAATDQLQRVQDGQDLLRMSHEQQLRTLQADLTASQQQAEALTQAHDASREALDQARASHAQEVRL